MTKILVISNFYPPYYVGGYEIGCYDVVEYIRKRGYQVKVLTSKWQTHVSKLDYDVYRLLITDFEWDKKNTNYIKYFFKLILKEMNNQKVFCNLCKNFKPDLIYIWNMRTISISIVFLAQQKKIPVSFFISDDWLSKWDVIDNWYSFWYGKSNNILKNLIKEMLRLFVSKLIFIPKTNLSLENVQFTSKFLKSITLKKEKEIKNMKVIYWGIDTDKFLFKNYASNPKKLLYVGRLEPYKGIHTAIEALYILSREYVNNYFTLTIVGKSFSAKYSNEIETMVKKFNLEGFIKFNGFVERDKLSTIYYNNEILIFPSIWEEPFSITILEAMSCGLAVVSTATGGSSEILKDGENCLIFNKDDARDCASKVIQLVNDFELYEKIRQNGVETIKKNFTFCRMVNQIEDSINELISHKSAC